DGAGTSPLQKRHNRGLRGRARPEAPRQEKVGKTCAALDRAADVGAFGGRRGHRRRECQKVKGTSDRLPTRLQSQSLLGRGSGLAGGGEGGSGSLRTCSSLGSVAGTWSKRSKHLLPTDDDHDSGISRT